MLKAQAGNERASLGFREAVIAAFSFLVDDFCFSCVSQYVTYVRYESDSVFLNVYHGRSSFELNVEIGERVNKRDMSENPFTIGEILKLVNPGEAKEYRPYQASKAESVKKCVDELAHLVKTYANMALCGDHAFFQEVSGIRRQSSDELLRMWELNRVRREVETAWRDKNFRRVVEIYEPVEKDLTPAEVRKLEYAKKKCLS